MKPATLGAGAIRAKLRKNRANILRLASIFELLVIVAVWSAVVLSDVYPAYLQANYAIAAAYDARFEVWNLEAEIASIKERQRGDLDTYAPQDLIEAETRLASLKDNASEAELLAASQERQLGVFLFRTLLSANSIVLAAAFVVDVFQVLLNGRSILVSFLTSGRGLEAVVRREADSGRMIQQKGSGEKRDPILVEEQFADFVERSEHMVKTAQRRPNALLFFGTLVSVIGIGVFIATIPGLFAPPPPGTISSDFIRVITHPLGTPRFDCFGRVQARVASRS